MNRRALICGVSGQDGSLLAEFLLGQGYDVHGTTRRPPGRGIPNAAQLGIEHRLIVHTCGLSDIRELSELLSSIQPDEIYYLAAQSSPGMSFEHPLETWDASAMGIVRLLRVARAETPNARILYAASGDCFGESSAAHPLTEESAFTPRSPYAAAKCAGHHAVSVARLTGQFACSAFLFSHESPLRSDTFVIGKIVAAVCRIATGSKERLQLGTVEVIRDWGWAAEYVRAMWLMLQHDSPRDFLIATGQSRSLAEFLEMAFAAAGLDHRDHTDVGAIPNRPADIAAQFADPSRAREALGWQARVQLPEIAALLVKG